MLVRLGIRFLAGLVGVAVGLLISAAVLSTFSISGSAVVEATLLF